MIPILYSGLETSFTSNGLGRLNDIIECICTEERNGIYEVEFTYPITGKFYQQMITMVEAYATGDWTNSGVIGCIHDDKHDVQPFDLYAVSAPINGIATFNAHHISYRLGREVVVPFTATSAADAFSQLPLKISGGTLFTFWTDKATNGDFKLEHPENVRNILGGKEGSFLDYFGSGEYQFDKFAVKLYQNRGVNSGVTIRYGKNLTDANRDIDSSGCYNAIAPYWSGQLTDDETGESQDVMVTLVEVYVQSPNSIGDPVVAVVDFSSEFDEMPTQNELRARTLQYLSSNKPWIPDDNIKISFVQLWQTEEYKDVAILQRLSICDQINVYYEDLGIFAEEQEIVKVVYNVILERYDEMELGKPETSLASSLSADAVARFESELEKARKSAVTSSMLQVAIKHATDLITGGLGGHVVFTLNADGQPEEILIMDTDNISTAVNVWRWNQNGLGHSSNGYNGPFSDVALTADGAINAALITTGTMLANIIKGGTLSLGGYDNGNGVMRLYDASNNEILNITRLGIEIIGQLYHNDWGTDFGSSGTTLNTNDTYYSQFKHYALVDDGGLHLRFKQYTKGTNTFNSYSLIQNPSVQEAGELVATPSAVILRSSNGRVIQLNSRNNNHYLGAYIQIGNYSTLGSDSSMASDYPGDIRILGNDIRIGNGGVLSFMKTYSSSPFAPNLLNDLNYQAKFYFSGGSFNIDIYNPYYNSTASYRFEDDWSSFSVDQLYVNGVSVEGTKSRIVETDDYSKRALYCYETPTPMFGDLGEATLDENGEAYVFLDPIFAETISSDTKYQVFLQKYGNGNCWVSERKPGYFIINGTPGLGVGWELKAKQRDYDQLRMEKFDTYHERGSANYGGFAADYIQELYEGRMGNA